MATRADWIAANRAYLGVPFLHQGRSRIGMDCVGLLACAATDIGFPNEVQASLRDYFRAPDSAMFAERIHDFLQQKPYNRLQAFWEQAIPGDVLAFWIDREYLPRHVALYTGRNNLGQPMVIHAYARTPRAVIEMPIDTGYWLQRVWGIFSFPALED